MCRAPPSACAFMFSSWLFELKWNNELFLAAAFRDAASISGVTKTHDLCKTFTPSHWFHGKKIHFYWSLTLFAGFLMIQKCLFPIRKTNKSSEFAGLRQKSLQDLLRGSWRASFKACRRTSGRWCPDVCPASSNHSMKIRGCLLRVITANKDYRAHTAVSPSCTDALT